MVMQFEHQVECFAVFVSAIQNSDPAKVNSVLHHFYSDKSDKNERQSPSSIINELVSADYNS